MERLASAALIALLLLLLTGCVTTRRVPVPCITTADLPQRPAWAVEALPDDASPAELAVALWAEHLQRRAYLPQIDALIGACTE